MSSKGGGGHMGEGGKEVEGWVDDGMRDRIMPDGVEVLWGKNVRFGRMLRGRREMREYGRSGSKGGDFSWKRVSSLESCLATDFVRGTFNEQ